jgi:hypothetical protein
MTLNNAMIFLSSKNDYLLNTRNGSVSYWPSVDDAHTLTCGWLLTCCDADDGKDFYIPDGASYYELFRNDLLLLPFIDAGLSHRPACGDILQLELLNNLLGPLTLNTYEQIFDEYLRIITRNS